MTSQAESSVASAHVEVVADEIVVELSATALGRRSRLFFRSILGGREDGPRYRIAQHGRSIDSLLVRIVDWLDSKGIATQVSNDAARFINPELQRRESFRRTRDALARASSEAPVPWAPLENDLIDAGWIAPGNLREHQRRAIAHALTGANVANFSVPGSGKTAVALAAIALHLRYGTIDRAIVVGPLASFAPWESETKRTLGTQMQVGRAQGTRRRRQEVYASGWPTILLLSYATAAADADALVRFMHEHQCLLVLDESHRIKRFRGGRWAPALRELSKRAVARLVMSGTPMPQSGRDLYSQLAVLWPDGQLTGTADVFGARVDSDFAGVVRDVAPFISRASKAELDLPPITMMRLDVPLSGPQYEIYSLVSRRVRDELKVLPSTVAQIAALRGRTMRLIQAATNPALLGIADPYFLIPELSTEAPGLASRLGDLASPEVPAKFKAARDIVADIARRGGKVVCWSTFLSNLDSFTDFLRRDLGLPTFQVDGRVPAGRDDLRNDPLDDSESPGYVDTRETLIDRFLRTNGPSILVANPASCSESISLHSSCHNAIYLDRTYDCAQYLQSIDRIHRLGLGPDATTDIYILQATLDAGPTIDQLVDQRLEAKAARMRLLLEGAELHPLALSEDPRGDAEGDDEDRAALVRYLLGLS